MKTQCKIQVTIAALFFMVCNFVNAQLTDYKAIADNTVNRTVKVQPGDQVIISGNVAQMPLIEEITMAVELAGGKPHILISSDKILFNRFHNVPVDYLKNEDYWYIHSLINADIVIALPEFYEWNPIFKGLPEEKMQYLNLPPNLEIEYNQLKVRIYYFRYATKESAGGFGIPQSDFDNMILKALGADNSKIVARCSLLNKIISEGKLIKVISPDGTNFTASLSGRRAMINDGVITPEDMVPKNALTRRENIPSGLVSVIPIEDSGNGVIVSKTDLLLELPLKMVKGAIQKGIITSVEAKEGNDVLQNYLKEMDTKGKTMSYIGIGVNPDLKVGIDPALFINEAEGMVYIGFGNNLWAGGDNAAGKSWYFPVVNSTIEVDGKIIFKEGKFQL
jgi:leucyl aminopeptidase (aminopeptidase T)